MFIYFVYSGVEPTNDETTLAINSKY